jgi:uncharacterized protein DUF3152
VPRRGWLPDGREATADTAPCPRGCAVRPNARETLLGVTSSGPRAPREAQDDRRDDRAALPPRRSPGPGQRRPDPRLQRAADPAGRPPGRPPLRGPGPSPRQPAARHPAAGPLVARRDPVPVVRVRPPVASRSGWWRRFVRRHGWRAYAIPLLTIATLATLVDLATGVPDGEAREGDAAVTQTSTAPVAPTTPPAPAEGEGAPAQTPAAPADTGFVEQGAGTVSVVDGTSAVHGTGPLERFVVEVEDGIGVDGAQFAAAVEATLGDPRSWGHDGQLSFQRVGADEAASGDYDFRVSLVSPGSMEVYCPGVGTGGYTSCRYGERAVINLARWETAVPDYADDVATYRLYVVNHEVGHALGHGHEQCPGPGRPAPVMEQQTLGLQGCVKNAWPYP